PGGSSGSSAWTREASLPLIGDNYPWSSRPHPPAYFHSTGEPDLPAPGSLPSLQRRIWCVHPRDQDLNTLRYSSSMNPVDASTTIPDPPPGFVPRENLNMTIDTMLQGDADAVIVQGLDGVGKTTVLNSYARSRSASSICLFLQP